MLYRTIFFNVFYCAHIKHVTVKRDLISLQKAVSNATLKRHMCAVTIFHQHSHVRYMFKTRCGV